MLSCIIVVAMRRRCAIGGERGTHRRHGGDLRDFPRRELGRDATVVPMKFRSLLFALLTASAGAAEPYFPPPDSEGGWRMAILPAEMRRLAGIDDERLDRAF